MLDQAMQDAVMHLFYTTDNNSDAAIANKLHVSKYAVTKLIRQELNTKIERINKQVNERYENQRKADRITSTKNERISKLVKL